MRSMRTRLGLAVMVALGMAGCAVEEAEPIVEDLNDAWEELQADDGSADSASCSGVIVPDRRGFDRRIALTFDDGPNLTNTAKVLEILRAHGVKATFFVNGRNVTSEAHKDLLREMVEDGHIIGNHTSSHPNSVNISLSSLRTEIENTGVILQEVGMTPDRLFFRFPFGSSNCGTADLVRSYGYHITGWHIDTADWCFAAGGGYCKVSTFRYVPDGYRGDYVGFTLSQARSNGGGVLLMHDIHSFTVGQLDALITALEDDGFTFVTLDDTSAFPLLNGVTPEPQPFVGTPCTDSSQCDFIEGGAQGYCATFETTEGTTAGYCSVGCEGYCPDRWGFAGTFCVESSQAGVGMCAPKAEDANQGCAAIPGTHPQEAARFIGSSSAPARTATVCLP